MNVGLELLLRWLSSVLTRLWKSPITACHPLRVMSSAYQCFIITLCGSGTADCADMNSKKTYQAPYISQCKCSACSAQCSQLPGSTAGSEVEEVVDWADELNAKAAPALMLRWQTQLLRISHLYLKVQILTSTSKPKKTCQEKNFTGNPLYKVFGVGGRFPAALAPTLTFPLRAQLLCLHSGLLGRKPKSLSRNSIKVRRDISGAVHGHGAIRTTIYKKGITGLRQHT